MNQNENFILKTKPLVYITKIINTIYYDGTLTHTQLHNISMATIHYFLNPQLKTTGFC